MRIIYSYCLTIAFSVLCFSSYSQALNTKDSLALVDLYNSTQGDFWTKRTNWLSDKPASTWFGVTVTNGRVTSLNLGSNKLNGLLPASLGDLSMLETLYMNHNYIRGTLPSSIGNLSHLSTILLSYNYMSGALPATIGNLSGLTFLALNWNSLTGDIPSSIGNLTNLTLLDLSFNHLTSIPATIGNLIHLERLELSTNNLTGQIPATLGNLASLKFLTLSYNQLQGSIPSTLGDLSNTNLLSLDLSNNQLSGPIPGSLGNLSALNNLYLNSNHLSGTVPSALKNLTRLGAFHIFDNELTDTFPSDLIEAGNLGGLLMQDNHFTFTSLEPLAQIAVLYAPQHSIALHKKADSLFSVSAGGTLTNNTYHLYKDGNLIAEKSGDSTFVIRSPGQYYITVTNTVATALTLYSDTVAVPDTAFLCPPASGATLSARFVAGLYQWQVDSGNGFVNLRNNEHYSGVDFHDLTLSNIPSSWYGYQYRCVGNSGNSNIYILKFADKWVGGVTNDWENPSNWSCGTLPDINTDVVIEDGNVVLSSNRSCRTLTVKSGASLTVKTGVILTITH